MALALRKEEGLGLGLAIAAHAAIVAVLLLRPQAKPVVQPPERIEVTISDEVGLTSTAPQPSAPAAPSIAPTLGEPQPAQEPAEAEPAPAEPDPAPAPPKPAPPPPVPRKAEPAPKPSPRATQRPKPAPKEKAKEPAPKAPPKKAPAPEAPAKKAPAPKAPAPKAPAKKAEAKAPAAKAPAAKAPAKSNAPAGGSRIGADFLEGVTGGSSESRANTSAPAAATIGPAVRSSLASAISRQLKPRWQAPQGPDAEDLVTILSFSLNRDGSLAGAPQVVRQLGITDVNRNQAARHAEQAIRAVRLAAPFDLPEEYYDAWKRVSQFRFDKRLSQ
ncbi:hypothetical protein [Novosphingobium sp. M1R2S20]|uniref:Cell division and transport-associated protein TolA n=1 Tax=Novosphingobium rhizovicinum TaxID=3228928 RepID=A0ABV3RC78_9SPHN